MSLAMCLAVSWSMPWTMVPAWRTDMPVAACGSAQRMAERSMPRFTSLEPRMSRTWLATNSEGASILKAPSFLESSRVAPVPLRS